jgi:poly(3-hydroxybutyrate) depolymerase
MAMQWACNDDRVGGLVVVAAGLSEMQSKKCDAHVPLPTLLVFGEKDAINPYGGGTVAGVRSAEGREAKVLSASASGAFFAEQNGCKKPARRGPLVSPAGRTVGIRDRHRGCKKGKVEVISVPAGHVWPMGGTEYASQGASAFIARFLRKRVWSKRLRG